LSDEMSRTHGAALQAMAAAAGVTLALLDLDSAEAEPAALAGVDCAWYSAELFSGGPPPSPATRRFFSLVDQAPKLRWLHVMSAGTDLGVYSPSLDRGVTLSTSSGNAAGPIAQSVIAALLAHARGFPHWLEAQRERCWAPRFATEAPRDLAGQHAVVVGLGPIGLEIARLLRVLGLRITGVRRRPHVLAEVDRTAVYADLPGLLADCDWLLLCCPLSSETRGLVSAAALARLPPRARLINVGRGAVVDEAALIAALQSGRLAGAYLDVFEHEPLSPASPLWSLPNVWLSPHNAAASAGNRARDAARFKRCLLAYLTGGAPESTG
jgi:D-2-hydroxyacid dehydrogenase (NADP+)